MDPRCRKVGRRERHFFDVEAHGRLVGQTVKGLKRPEHAILVNRAD